MELILSPRLEAVAELVRHGAVLSDVGTDHALLPAHLLLCGKIKSAVASDIVAGPLHRAEETVRRYGLTGKITTVLTPGLAGIEKYAPTDVVIAGMGGQTIAEILKEAPFVKNPDLRLILQPMTKGELLRDFLAAEGFEITKELRVREQERIYVVLCCHYTGVPYTLAPLERLFGRVPQGQTDPLYTALLAKKEDQLQAVMAAKKENGLCVSEEEALLCAIKDALAL